ncbi:MAG: response regulator [Calditrichaceae bacterium]
MIYENPDEDNGKYEGNGETVLLVEDDPMILQMSKHFIESLGYNSILANSPEEAMRISKQYPDKIDILISDVIMPDMNGRELAENIQTERPEIKCLFMSGYTANVIAHRGIIDEGVDFIQKPFSLNSFGKKIREVLDE